MVALVTSSSISRRSIAFTAEMAARRTVICDGVSVPATREAFWKMLPVPVTPFVGGLAAFVSSTITFQKARQRSMNGAVLIDARHGNAGYGSMPAGSVLAV